MVDRTVSFSYLHILACLYGLRQIILGLSYGLTHFQATGQERGNSGRECATCAMSIAGFYRGMLVDFGSAIGKIEFVYLPVAFQVPAFYQNSLTA